MSARSGRLPVSTLRRAVSIDRCADRVPEHRRGDGFGDPVLDRFGAQHGGEDPMHRHGERSSIVGLGEVAAVEAGGHVWQCGLDVVDGGCHRHASTSAVQTSTPPLMVVSSGNTSTV